MDFSRPTLTALIAQAFQSLQARLAPLVPGVNPLLRRMVTRVFAAVIGAFFDALHGHLDWVVDQLFMLTASDAAVQRRAAEYGLGLLSAAFAAGSVTFTGINGSPIPLGTEWQSDDNGLFYRTTDAGEIASGTAIVPCQAETGGAAANLIAGVTGTLTIAVPGVAGTVAVASGGLTGGFVDGIDVPGGLRARLLARQQQPPQGGNANDYATWSKLVPGVTNVFVLPAYRGAGTVDVTFVMEGRSNIIPLSADVAAVLASIEANCPEDADVAVWAPTPYAINYTIHGLTPNNAQSQSAVAASLAAAIARYRAPATSSSGTGLVPYAALDEAIFDTPGITYELLTVPSTDVAVPAANVPVIGTGTFT